MEKDIADVLMKESLPDDVGELLTRLKDLIKLSRDEMVKYYDQWEVNDNIYRGIKQMDEADRAAVKRKAPVKFVMPVTYSQINTFVSFFLAVVNQRDYFYELGGTGQEDEKAAKVGQMVLEQNLEHNNFRYQKNKQFATDLAKYGVGVFKHSWTKETKTITRMVPVPVPTPVGLVPPPPEMVQQSEDVTSYLGNVITCVTPFHWFPDPRLPVTRFMEGEFCASEDEYSRSQMRTYQRSGLAAGVEWIGNVNKDMMENRRRFGFMADPDAMQLEANQKQNFVILTEVQVWLNPKETMFNNKPLDEKVDQDTLYLVWIANDSRIVRLEPLSYPHRSFTFDAAQYEEDQINFLNDGMADKLGPLQDTIDWFINSRVTNVRKVIGNQLIVDPKGVEIQDLRDRKPVIRLKAAVQGMGVDKWVKQLNLQDVTVTHLQDVEFLNGYAKQTTGITENLLGQFAAGRRSAAEAKNVNSNATARIMSIVNSVWNTAYLPMGRKLLENLRAGMDEPTIVRVIGQMNALQMADGVQSFMKVNPEDLIGDYDFLIFDGTLPSQRATTAQALQELLTLLVTKPEATFIFQYDPQALMSEILELRGVRNADRFKLTPPKAQQLLGMAQAARNAMAPQPALGAGGAGNAGQPQPGAV